MKLPWWSSKRLDLWKKSEGARTSAVQWWSNPFISLSRCTSFSFVFSLRVPSARSLIVCDLFTSCPSKSVCVLVCVCARVNWVDCAASAMPYYYTLLLRPFFLFPIAHGEGSKQTSTVYANILIEHHMLFHRLISIVPFTFTTHAFSPELFVFLLWLLLLLLLVFVLCFLLISLTHCAGVCFDLLLLFCYYWCCWYFQMLWNVRACASVCLAAHMLCVCKKTTVNIVDENRNENGQGKVKSHYPVLGDTFSIYQRASRRTHARITDQMIDRNFTMILQNEWTFTNSTRNRKNDAKKMLWTMMELLTE